MLTLKVINSSSRSIAPGHGFEAHTADISQNGVRVRLGNAVPPGTELQMWVISPRSQETLVLDGTVRWCLAAPGDPTLHQAGIHIAHTPTGDYRRWLHMVAELLGA